MNIFSRHYAQDVYSLTTTDIHFTGSAALYWTKINTGTIQLTVFVLFFFSLLLGWAFLCLIKMCFFCFLEIEVMCI